MDLQLRLLFQLLQQLMCELGRHGCSLHQLPQLPPRHGLQRNNFLGSDNLRVSLSDIDLLLFSNLRDLLRHPGPLTYLHAETRENFREHNETPRVYHDESDDRT